MLICMNFISFGDAMPKLHISEDTIKQTTKCDSNFSCLNYEENPKCRDGLALCPVEYKIGYGKVFVHFNKDSSCTYNVPFGINKRMCTCPVRNEIYIHYYM